MILASHQPNFLPYMGFFYKAYKSDILVLSEDVLYSKKGMHNWNYIYTQEGKKKLTLPVTAHQESRLEEVMLFNPAYNVAKLAKTLEQEYRKAPHFEEGMALIDFMKALVEEGRVMMSDFNIEVIKYIITAFGMEHLIVLSSTEDLDISGHKDERIIMMCEKTGAYTYYSGTGAKAYHIDYLYNEKGISLVYSDYEPVVYMQIHGDFIENLSVIDYIFNCGYEIPQEWGKR